MSATWWRDKAEFAKRWEAHGWNLSLMADTEGIALTTANRWRAIHHLTFPDHIRPKGNTRDRAKNRVAAQQPPLVPILDAEIRVEGDFGIMSDMHLPVTRPDVLNRWLDDCQQRGITRAILPGDLFNQDKWSRHEHKQGGAGPDVEREWAVWAFGEMLGVFDTLTLALGNHEENLHRTLDYTVGFDRCMRMLLGELPTVDLSRIQITGRDYVIVDTERGPWRICHTRTYSRQPLAYPGRLALRHGMHIAAGHRHHHAQGFAANGKSIVELGGAFDEDRMAYTKRYTDDFPMMANGYMLLVDGAAHCPMLAA